MKRTKFLAGTFAILSLTAVSYAQTSKPSPATQAVEMVQDKSARMAYGTEMYRLVNQKDEIVSGLRNGLTVIVKRVDSPVLAVRGYVYTGGVYEGQWLGGGLSHLLEHLVAGGSSQRRTEAENRNLLQQLGNNSNAYTTYDHTAYFINTTADHLDQGVDLLTGWLLGALITPEEYRREYQVVQRELEMGKGQPERQFSYMSSMNRYQVNPARVPVIGYQEVIQGLSRDDVYNYYKLTYQPNNMVLSVAGNLDPEVMLKAVQKYVNDAKPGREFLRNIPEEPPVLAPRTMVGTFPKLGRAILELSFPTIKLTNPDLYALDLLASVLSDGEASLFVEEIRDKRQLAYSVNAGSYTPEFADGSFEIQMRLDPKKIAAATDAVLELIDSVKKDGVDPERIARAKTQMRMAHVRSKQTCEEIASGMATDFMSTGDPHFSDRYVERVEKVTPEQLRDVARKYLDRERLLTTAMLPAEYVGAAGLPKAEDLLRPVVPTTQQAPAEKGSEVTRVELDNGVILLLKRLTTSPLVVMNMYAVGGVTAESASNNGISNLTMEMLTRGTKTKSAEQIAEFFDSIGSEMNTACGNNSWFWTLSCLNKDLDKAIEMYADIVHNPSMPDDETEAMKQRIIAAIDAQDANWEAASMRYFKQEYFGPLNSPYQFLPIGKKENVAALKPDDLRKWYEQHVLKSRRVLAIYGDIDVEKTKALAAKFLGAGAKIDTGDVAPGKKAIDPVPFSDKSVPSVEVSRVEINKTEAPLAGIVIGFDSGSVIGAPANYPVDVADTMTSGWGYPTGYLHEILRGRGLVYMVHAQNVPGRNEKTPGTFMVISGCEAQNVNEVIDTILENIARVQGSAADMQEGWFQRSKQLIVTSDAMDNETAAEQATTAALDELYGLGYNFHAQFADKIKAVTLDDVRAAGKYLLNKCVVTVSTPRPDLVKVEKGRREYRSFPTVDLTPRGVQHDTGAGGK